MIRSVIHLPPMNAAASLRLWGRNAGYIALWCGIANGAEDILLPERYDGDEQALINRISENRKRERNITSSSMQRVSDILVPWQKRIEAATGIETPCYYFRSHAAWWYTYL